MVPNSDVALELFRDRDRSSDSFRVIQLVTVDPSGRPRIALLGDAEIFFGDAATVNLLLWQKSHTAKNLTIGSQGLLSVVVDQAFVSIWFVANAHVDVNIGSTAFKKITGAITASKTDTVPYARLLGGLEFELLDDGARSRWVAARRVLNSEAG